MVLLNRAGGASLMLPCTSAKTTTDCPSSRWGHSSALRLGHTRQPQTCRSGARARGDWVSFSVTLIPSPSFLQSLQKDKMGEAYSEIGKKGEVSPS